MKISLLSDIVNSLAAIRSYPNRMLLTFFIASIWKCIVVFARIVSSKGKRITLGLTLEKSEGKQAGLSSGLVSSYRSRIWGTISWQTTPTCPNLPVNCHYSDGIRTVILFLNKSNNTRPTVRQVQQSSVHYHVQLPALRPELSGRRRRWRPPALTVIRAVPAR